jgi:cysteine desulfurase
MAVAYELTRTEQAVTAPRLAALRDRLRDAVLAVPNVELTGHPRKRLPGHLSVIVRDAEGEAVVQNLDLAGVAVSTGSACTTGSTEPSHVLTALGYPDEEARGSLRITVGRANTDHEIEQAGRIIPETILQTRTAALAIAADPLGEQVGA